MQDLQCQALPTVAGRGHGVQVYPDICLFICGDVGGDDAVQAGGQMPYLLRLLSRSENLVKVPRPHEVTDELSKDTSK